MIEVKCITTCTEHDFGGEGSHSETEVTFQIIQNGSVVAHLTTEEFKKLHEIYQENIGP